MDVIMSIIIINKEIFSGQHSLYYANYSEVLLSWNVQSIISKRLKSKNSGFRETWGSNPSSTISPLYVYGQITVHFSKPVCSSVKRE